MPRTSFSRVLFVVLATLTFVLGALGLRSYLESSGGDVGALNVLFGVLALFGASSFLDSGEVPLSLEIAQLTGPATTVLAAFSVFRRAAAARYRLWRASSQTGHVVLVGVSETGQLLARQLASLNEPVVVGIDLDPSPAAQDIFDRPGWALLSGDVRDPTTLSRTGAQRARLAYVATGQDGVDVLAGRVVHELMATGSGARGTVRVQIDSPDLCLRLQRDSLSRTLPDEPTLEYVNYLELEAMALLEQLVERLALVANCGIDEQCADQLVIIGDTALAGSIHATATRAHQARQALPAATSFAAPPVWLPDTKMPPPALEDPKTGRVVVVHLPNAQTTIAEAARRSTDDEATLVVALCATGDEPIESTASAATSPLLILDPDHLVQTPSVLSNGPIEAMARLIHLDYLLSSQEANATPTPAMVPWEQLAETYREASRAQARDIGHKVKQVNCELTANSVPSAKLTPDEVNLLARDEHERWMADREAAGWCHGPERDGLHKLHPDMVDFSQLSDEAQEKDRRAIKRLHGLAALLGLVVARQIEADT